MKGLKKINLSKLDIIGIILIVLCIPIIILNLVIVIKGTVNPEEVPKIFGVAPLIVESDSMDLEYGNPGAFNKHDLIFIKDIDPSELKENDIITYRNDKVLITHRIIRKDVIDGQPVFITKGDFSPSEDDPVSYEQVIGVYIGRLPQVGGVAMFLQKPIGVMLLIGVPVLIVLGIDFVKKNKDKKNAEAKNAELEAEIQRLKAQQENKEN